MDIGIDEDGDVYLKCKTASGDFVEAHLLSDGRIIFLTERNGSRDDGSVMLSEDAFQIIREALTTPNRYSATK